MVKIRIYDPKSGFRINMPIPYHFFINILVRKSIANMFVSRTSFKDERTYDTVKSAIDALDFAELRHALHSVREYKGMSIVDVESNDGTIVKITL